MGFWKLKAALLCGAGLFLSQAALAAITNVSSSVDSTYSYYSFNYGDAPTFFRIYLDTDSSAGTGYAVNSIGANYMIENGNLYRYSGSGGAWGWTSVRAITYSSASLKASFKVARADIGNPSSLKFIANYSSPQVMSSIMSQSLSVVLATPTPAPTATPASTETWTRCASEGGVCSFSGTRQVRYGANGVFAYKSATGSIGCDNATFGDPVYGVAKACDYSSIVSGGTSPTPTPTPAGTPTATPTPTPAPTPTPVVVSGPSTQVSYAVSSAAIVNPDRGFFWMTDCRANPKSVAALQAYRSQNGHSVLHCMWYLRDFKSSPISSTVLSQLSTQMDNVRAAGFKMIIRFAYTNTDINDAPLSIVKTHLDQVAPLFAKNGDIISLVQTGLIGQWGEMSTSANFGGPSTAQNWADRKAVIDKLLSVVPADRQVAVRTPAFKMNPYGSTPLSDAEAFTGTARARVTHYNDCFMSSSNDYGTYLNSSEHPFLEQDSKYLAMSGETCAVSSYNDCSNAIAEMTKLHWTHLHEGYNTAVYDKWKSSGCFATVQQRLGYRLNLTSATLPTSGKIGQAVSVSLNLQNTGFAAPINARKVELVLRNSSTGAVFRVALKADPRRWLPGSIAVNEAVVIPSNVPVGSYALFLALPDPAPALYTRPEYSIQLANTSIWEASTGFNNLKANIVIGQ